MACLRLFHSMTLGRAEMAAETGLTFVNDNHGGSRMLVLGGGRRRRTNMSTLKLRDIVAATIVGGGAFFVSENVWTTASPTSLVTQAEARIGRPWTPLSVAGVARRHYRRAVVASAITGGALAAGYGYGYGSGYGYGYPYSGYATGY